MAEDDLVVLTNLGRPAGRSDAKRDGRGNGDKHVARVPGTAVAPDRASAGEWFRVARALTGAPDGGHVSAVPAPALTRARSRTRLRTHAHALPVGALTAVFAASRIWAWEAGVRFDSSPLGGFWQILDQSLLKTRLLQSIWYLHAQPPLFNLLLGLDLKLFGSGWATAAHGFQIALGLVIALAMYLVLVEVRLPRWWSAAAAALFAVSPAAILVENWLFYEYLVAALLLLATLAFVLFQRRPSAPRALLVFSLLAAVCLVRASFQLVAPLLVLFFMLAMFRGQRRAILAGAAIPLLVVAGVSVKNLVLFGTPSTSSWAGMNLMQIDQAGFRGNDEQRLQQQGVISPIAGIPVFRPLDAYRGVIRLPTSYSSIPALSETVKPSSGVTNYNNIGYVKVSNRYLQDFGQILVHDPIIYLRGVWTGVTRAATPASDYYFFVANRGKIEPWVRGYDAVVLWQPHVGWRFGRPSGTAWGIVAAYIAALLFGAAEMLRVLRRRGGSPTLAFVWLLLAYATFALTFGEVAENQRVRFVGDPLVTVLVAVIAARIAAYLRTPRPVAAATGSAVVEERLATGPVRPRIAFDLRVAAGLIALVAAAAFALALIVAVQLPYGEWDAMSFGAWSRLIATHWPHIRFSSVGAEDYQRPLFYFLQGTVWAVFGFHQALGRVLSLLFSATLAGALGFIGWKTAGRRDAALTAALAVGLLTLSPVFERYIASGLSDVPVAAMVALTAAIVFVRARLRVALPLLAAASAATVLAKPPGLVSLAALAGANLIGPTLERRRRATTSGAIGLGAVIALIYDELQAHSVHLGLHAFLTTGNDGFYAALASEHRRATLLDTAWLGANVRPILVFALVYALARVARASHRASVLAGFVAASIWTIVGPHLAHSGDGIPIGSAQGLALLALVACLLFALEAPAESIPSQADLLRLLVWAVPPAAVWAVYAVYDVRLLSAAWPPLILLLARSTAPAFAGAAAQRRRLALALPAVALAVLVFLGTEQINGLGSHGWTTLQAGLGNPAAMENLALGGDFEAELAALRPQVQPGDTLVTDDYRLPFWFREHSFTNPTDCAAVRALTGPKLLVVLESDEERAIYGAKASGSYWANCPGAHLTPVAERPGAFAILSSGAVTQVAGGCNAPPPTPGIAVEFGRFATPGAAQALLTRIRPLGFVQAKVEQLGCGMYRVAETGIPSDSVGQSIVAEAANAHLKTKLVTTAQP